MTLKISSLIEKVLTAGFRKILKGQHDTENWLLYRKNLIAAGLR